MGREQNLTETLNYNRRHRRAVATAIATATATTIHLLDTSANATTCFDDFFSRCLFRRCVSSGCDTVTFEKEPMPSSPASGEESNEKKSFSSKNKFSSRNASSKYDFVKIPNHVAIKIALELKKLLIDNSLLYVSQSNLEVNLFKVMESRGYGEEYISHYKMMTRFHHQRVPLVILVCGTACVGKSTIATQLAQRLNYQMCCRFVMKNGAKECEVIVSGKLRAQRAKSMKFKDGYMISSGQPVKNYIDSAVRHVLLSVCILFLL
ncbi:uncharacterized protein LOC107639128 isoform X3 [Arachis ipaensis]|uniref:uncharacterized protein LOC107639128 isoform X3 n=1 Tax=Arachis ipaensis TaxID=130454 RepID=UPI000A2B3F13|nr:uncharacterized protein LOC107639128 isoform X3 [Arachis ipaensis]XP_025649144.1 uncharacterized protein LOC112743925 isoform X3 [Arachis hypogaea]